MEDDQVAEESGYAAVAAYGGSNGGGGSGYMAPSYSARKFQRLAKTKHTNEYMN